MGDPFGYKDELEIEQLRKKWSGTLQPEIKIKKVEWRIESTKLILPGEEYRHVCQPPETIRIKKIEPDIIDVKHQMFIQEIIVGHTIEFFSTWPPPWSTFEFITLPTMDVTSVLNLRILHCGRHACKFNVKVFGLGIDQ